VTPDNVPQTGGYMVAAYIVAAVILLTYTVMLWRRGSRKETKS
jgi:hypothetical protein